MRNRIQEVDAQLEALRVNCFADREQQIVALLEADTLMRAQLDDELRALRLQLKVRRENRIAELGEAIAIARSLGLKRRTTPSSVGAPAAGASSVVHTEVTTQRAPLYLMGTDALEAEQRVLRKRATDDFSDPRVATIRAKLALLATNRKVQVLRGCENDQLFLKGGESLRTESARLGAIRTDMSKPQIVNVDRLAVEPLRPVGSGRTVTVLLGVALGLVLGLLVASIRYILFIRPGDARSARAV